MAPAVGETINLSRVRRVVEGLLALRLFTPTLLVGLSFLRLIVGKDLRARLRSPSIAAACGP